jgi:hypothetical protein
MISPIASAKAAALIANQIPYAGAGRNQVSGSKRSGKNGVSVARAISSNPSCWPSGRKSVAYGLMPSRIARAAT